KSGAGRNGPMPGLRERFAQARRVKDRRADWANFSGFAGRAKRWGKRDADGGIPCGGPVDCRSPRIDPSCERIPPCPPGFRSLKPTLTVKANAGDWLSMPATF